MTANSWRQSSEYTLRAFTAGAVALPLMCGYQQPPLPAFFNQALAVALWAVVVFLAAIGSRSATRPGARMGQPWHVGAVATAAALWATLLTVLLAHAASGESPLFVAAPVAVVLTVALLLSTVVRADPHDPTRLTRWLQALLLGILLAALFNAVVALVQLAAPNWADDGWIARTVPPNDRASGNLRQPNQLATLMVWGLLATSYFWRRRPLVWLPLSAPLLATLAATGSRTGMVSLLLIVLVALARSRRVRAWRVKGWLMLLLTLLPALWVAETVFTRATASLATTLRLAVWRDTLEIIGQHPWAGVGWGQLNFAWTLTPLGTRAGDVFDHAHNLPLHLAAELGLPLAALVLTLLIATLWRARRALRSSEGATAGLLLATVLLHSLLEYPLWFSYFLLPSAFLLAWLAAASATPQEPSQESSSRYRQRLVVATLAALALTGVVYASREYQKAVSIHRAVGDPDALKRAIERARGSVLYGHFGDYAAIMLAGDAATPEMFDRPIHHVLDERLLAAYARMLVRTDQADRAAFVVARAREFPAVSAFDALPVVGASAPSAARLTARDFRR